MPARIDADERRHQVVEAVFRLVVAEGIDGLSLRKVVVEAGLNIGSVRHYFNGHEDLLSAAAERAGDRMGDRLVPHPPEALRGLSDEQALDALQTVVEAVLPVDAERRSEAIVLLEFILASRTRPVFRPLAERMAADLHDVMVAALGALDVADASTKAAQLTALIGGLTIDTVTPHGSMTVERLRATLRAQLRLLLKERR